MQITKKSSESPLTQSQIDKIGNSLIYLARNIEPLYKTKALKLLYLIEEISVRKFGIPFFGVDFQLWQLGPVVKDVFVDLSSDNIFLLREYVETTTVKENNTVVKAKAGAEFNDNEFSDCDIDVLKLVVNQFKNSTGKELIELTHRENFPWYVTAKKHGLLEDLENNRRVSTDIIVDMSTILDDIPELKEYYLQTLEFQRYSNYLNGGK